MIKFEEGKLIIDVKEVQRKGSKAGQVVFGVLEDLLHESEKGVKKVSKHLAKTSGKTTEEVKTSVYKTTQEKLEEANELIKKGYEKTIKELDGLKAEYEDWVKANQEVSDAEEYVNRDESVDYTVDEEDSDLVKGYDESKDFVAMDTDDLDDEFLFEQTTLFDEDFDKEFDKDFDEDFDKDYKKMDLSFKNETDK